MVNITHQHMEFSLDIKYPGVVCCNRVIVIAKLLHSSSANPTVSAFTE